MQVHRRREAIELIAAPINIVSRHFLTEMVLSPLAWCGGCFCSARRIFTVRTAQGPRRNLNLNRLVVSRYLVFALMARSKTISVTVKDFYHTLLHAVLIMSMEQFLLFPKLPVDVRLMIWEAALSEVHVLELQAAATAKEMPLRKLHPDLCPAAEVSKEAREVLMKSHALLQVAHVNETLLPPLYVNFSRCVVYIGDGSAIEGCMNLLIPASSHQQIECLAIHWLNWHQLILTCRRLMAFPALKTFVVAVPSVRSTMTRDHWLGIPSMPVNEPSILLKLMNHDEADQLPGMVHIPYLKMLIDDFLAFEKWAPGRRAPIVKIVVFENADVDRQGPDLF
jgi:hypothetical protein